MEKHDFSVFNHPRIFFAERGVPHGEVRFFEQNDLKTSRDFLIDYIWIGESRYSIEGWGGLGTTTPSLIRNININWQIVDRAPIWPLDEFSVTSLQNYWDADRGWNPCSPADTGFCTLLWRHALRWIYNPTQDVRIDWEALGANGGALRPQLTIRPAMAGTSLKTGHRRIYGMDLIYPAQTVAPTQRFSGTASAPNSMGNLGDDPYSIEDFGFSTTDEWDDGDLGWLSGPLRMKVIPSQGEAWSDVPLPLGVYALQQSIPAARWVTYQPTGGPLLLKAGQSFVARVRNAGTLVSQDTFVQIALIGRTAPGIGSLGMVG